MSVTYTNSFMPLRTAGALIVIACNSPQVLARADEHRFSAPRPFFTQTSSEQSASYEVIDSVDHFSVALGAKGIARLQKLRLLEDGWNGAGAKALDERSVEAAKSFFEAQELIPRNMAVFFNQEGQLSVGWEDSHGYDVELTFAPDAVSLFVEHSDEQISAHLESAAELHELVRRVKETL